MTDADAPTTSSRVRIWKYIFGFLAPLLLSPIPIIVDSKESRCGYVILLMACYWIVEPIPLAATSLLPIVLLPLLGIISTNEASEKYLNATNMMFVGGLFMAVALEDCNLHKRIALNVLKRVGATAAWMMFGFMMTSMFLSMWISNTATAALMVPIIEAVMEEFDSRKKPKQNIALRRISVINVESKNIHENGITAIRFQPRTESEPPQPISDNEEKEEEERAKKVNILKKAMFLSVAYSTNIGGTGTLTGTGPNLVILSVVEKLFPESKDLSFDKWMMYNIPVVIFCVCIGWVFLYLIHVRKASSIYTDEMKENFKRIIEKKHRELGNMTFKEKSVTFLFILLVMLWIFRDPHFIKGWSSYFPVKVHDATPAIGIPLLLFLIPAEPSRIGRSPPLIEWSTIQHKVPWGVIILLGGGFSLAVASEKSGLSSWITSQLLSLNISSPLAAVTLLSFMTAILTEFTSNVATATILLPVVAELAMAMKIHPIYFMLPVTISCSFAFMLPVATPPNAIVYEAGKMKAIDMIIPGFLMNILCVSIEILMINTLGKVIFNFDEFPLWANRTMINIS